VLSFTRKSGDGGHLFGSVTSADIAAELAAKGFEVDRRKIALSEPLKTVGDFSVAIKLHREVTAQPVAAESRSRFWRWLFILKQITVGLGFRAWRAPCSGTGRRGRAGSRWLGRGSRRVP
jgi:hypothetical protein